MTDPVENVVAPAAIERALLVYQRLNPCDQSVLLQARRIVTQHIYGMVDKGECDEQRLTVGGLARLKSVERDHAIRSASASGSEPRKSKSDPRPSPKLELRHRPAFEGSLFYPDQNELHVTTKEGRLIFDGDFEATPRR